MRRVFDIGRVADVPPMARRNYVYELRHLLAFGMFAGVVESNTSSIVAAKTFGGSDLLVTIVWTAPFIANILSIVWAAAARGRPKLQVYYVLCACAALTLATVAFAPDDPAWGAWIFAAQILATRLFLAGVVAVRSSIWNANYGRAYRARLVARLQSLRFIIGLMAVSSLSLLFDENPQHYRWVYPASAAVGLASLWLLRGMRVRGEAREMALYHRVQAARHAERPRSRWRAFVESMAESVTILRRDRMFARYMAAQFLLGSANFLAEPTLNIVLTKELGWGYFASSGLMDVLPTVVMLVAVHYWATYFDRVGAVQFRGASSVTWLTGFSLAALAVMLIPRLGGASAVIIGLLVAARFFKGIGRGGGVIAWHIGHLHFAPRDEVESYMSVHMALTGVRGIAMPFVALGIHKLAGHAAVLVLAVAVAAVGTVMFHRLARDDRRLAAEACRADPAAEPLPNK